MRRQSDRLARKSRLGCKQCNERHVKCDEHRPTCANCNLRQLPCSFVYNTPAKLAQFTRGHPSGNGISQSSGSGISTPSHGIDKGPSNRAPSPAVGDETYSIRHLELLHNFRAVVLSEWFVDVAAANGYMNVLVQQGVQDPYVMDQVLALSSLHMSTTRPDLRDFYLREATRLKTRALATFNDPAQMAERQLQSLGRSRRDPMSCLLFSSLLSQHALFDAFSIRDDFSAFLEKTCTGFRLSHGMLTMVGNSWPSLATQYWQLSGMDLPGSCLSGGGSFETRLTPKLGPLRDHIVARARNGHLTLRVAATCAEAVDTLRESCSCAPYRGSLSLAFLSTRVSRWAMTVSVNFIKLLEQRLPEALLIMAYYAVLIHESRAYWAFGDAGAFIVRSVTGLKYILSPVPTYHLLVRKHFLSMHA